MGTGLEGLLNSLNLNLQAIGSYSKAISKRMARLRLRRCGEKEDLRTGPAGGRERTWEAGTEAVAVGMEAGSTSWNGSGGLALSLGSSVIG